MIEYALMAAAVAVVVAAFLPVQVLPVISGVFSRILSVTGMMP
jgi:Flp pilus assembly pilin Flp